MCIIRDPALPQDGSSFQLSVKHHQLLTHNIAWTQEAEILLSLIITYSILSTVLKNTDNLACPKPVKIGPVV